MKSEKSDIHWQSTRNMIQLTNATVWPGGTVKEMFFKIGLLKPQKVGH